MTHYAEMFQNALMHLCLWSLVLIGVASAFCLLAPIAWDKIRSVFKDSVFKGVVCSVAVFGIVMYGGSKHIIRFDDGLVDNGSYATNDTVHIAWTFNSSAIPSGSSLYIDWRETGTTNEWENLGITTVGAMVWDYTVPNATNYDYFVWTSYIPPVPVHTNGVWEGYGGVTRNGNYITLRGRIVDKDGKWIADPKNKREWQENHQETQGNE